MERYVEAKKRVSDFCTSFVKSASQAANTGGHKMIMNMMRVISDTVFDAWELRWYEQEFDDCERITVERVENELGKKGFVEKSLSTESNSSASSSAFYKKGFSLC